MRAEARLAFKNNQSGVGEGLETVERKKDCSVKDKAREFSENCEILL